VLFSLFSNSHITELFYEIIARINALLKVSVVLCIHWYRVTINDCRIAVGVGGVVKCAS
jgi:hypothetical protein